MLSDRHSPPSRSSAYRAVKGMIIRATPRLSIGLPVYNGEDYLTESLEALLGQTYEDFELIISDNASTDGTADICRRYAKQDSRIRYFRQSRNLGCNPNHNFVIEQAQGELFKLASDDDLYARDLLKRCIDALDESPHFVLAHSWSALMDASGTVVNLVNYPVDTDAPLAPDRFRSMLFDGWGDDDGGVIRTSVLRQVRPYDSYHFADRVFTTEIGLHGPFYQVPDYLWFRRQHPRQAGMHRSVRDRCVTLDPRRAKRLRHPAVRLYAEYIWGYVEAIRRAPLSPEERRECYRHLNRWVASRALPVAGRIISRSGLEPGDSSITAPTGISVDTLVAGREGRYS
jgi:glycosyltransferase involved in cell wall biosynthesis